MDIERKYEEYKRRLYNPTGNEQFWDLCFWVSVLGVIFFFMTFLGFHPEFRPVFGIAVLLGVIGMFFTPTES